MRDFGKPSMGQTYSCFYNVGDVESLRDGIAAGAHYYLTKPLQAPLLLAVINAAIAQYCVRWKWRSTPAEPAISPSVPITANMLA
jgi:AmiR/NasT family two-component response regulator